MALDPKEIEVVSVVSSLNRVFIRTLKALGNAAEADMACRLAAEGWSVLRHQWPAEAERLNGVLHYLTVARNNHERGA